MPANMLMEPAGSSLKVIGRSRATVSAGPMPGRTPTAVPRRTPMSAKSRFIGWMATVSPCAREMKESMGRASDQVLVRPHWQGQGQELGEQDIDDQAGDEADDQVDDHGAPSEVRGGGREENRRGRDE